MESARHVFRVLFLLLALVVAGVIGRSFLVPASYGTYGPYRADDVATQASARVPLHGGVGSCRACHAERVEAVAAGAHARLDCEVCHGPVGAHARDGAKVADARIDRSFTTCARCHRRIDGRPAAFPQVVLDGHLAEQGAPGRAEGAVCLECHDPHGPTP